VKVELGKYMSRADPEDELHCNFADIVSNALLQSAERLEERRLREHAIAEEQQVRWNNGVALLNRCARPLIEQAYRACTSRGLPAVFEHNFDKKAACPRMIFYCLGSYHPHSEGRGPVPASTKMILESDGENIRIGEANSFSTYAEKFRICENVADSVAAAFVVVLESYFRSCERLTPHVG
jgi:hypothetical protein